MLVCDLRFSCLCRFPMKTNSFQQILECSNYRRFSSQSHHMLCCLFFFDSFSTRSVLFIAVLWFSLVCSSSASISPVLWAVFRFFCLSAAVWPRSLGGVPRINVVAFAGNLLRDTVVRRSCIFMPQGAKVAPKIFQIGHFGPQKQYGEPGVLQILAPHPKIPWPFVSMRKL